MGVRGDSSMERLRCDEAIQLLAKLGVRARGLLVASCSKFSGANADALQHGVLGDCGEQARARAMAFPLHVSTVHAGAQRLFDLLKQWMEDQTTTQILLRHMVFTAGRQLLFYEGLKGTHPTRVPLLLAVAREYRSHNEVVEAVADVLCVLIEQCEQAEAELRRHCNDTALVTLPSVTRIGCCACRRFL